MKNFEFQLESVLKYRQSCFEQARDSFVRAQESLARSARELEELIRKEQVHSNEYKNEQKGVLDIGKAVWHVRYLTFLYREKKRKLAEVESKKEEVQKCKDVLIEASKDKKALEKLKEKKSQEFLKNFLDWEQKQLDESSVNKYARLISHGM